jgi:hypothetical protein
MHIFYRVARIGGEVVTKGNGDDVAEVSWVPLKDLPSKRILAVDLEFTNHPSFRGLFA